jgi:hypothetical protein
VGDGDGETTNTGDAVRDADAPTVLGGGTSDGASAGGTDGLRVGVLLVVIGGGRVDAVGGGGRVTTTGGDGDAAVLGGVPTNTGGRGDATGGGGSMNGDGDAVVLGGVAAIAGDGSLGGGIFATGVEGSFNVDETIEGDESLRDTVAAAAGSESTVDRGIMTDWIRPLPRPRPAGGTAPGAVVAADGDCSVGGLEVADGGFGCEGVIGVDEMMDGDESLREAVGATAAGNSESTVDRGIMTDWIRPLPRPRPAGGTAPGAAAVIDGVAIGADGRTAVGSPDRSDSTIDRGIVTDWIRPRPRAAGTTGVVVVGDALCIDGAGAESLRAAVPAAAVVGDSESTIVERGIMTD